jgi:hypothetical protein
MLYAFESRLRTNPVTPDKRRHRYFPAFASGRRPDFAGLIEIQRSSYSVPRKL